MEALLNSLNDEQYAAVTSLEHYIRVIAGAGSGKTRVLATRIAYLIDNIGVLSNRILAITFTNKAANEMKDRVASYLKLPNCGANISTYHAFCSRFLREEISNIGYSRHFTIVDEEDQERIIKKLLKEYDEKYGLTPKKVRSYISYQKNWRIEPTKAALSPQMRLMNTIYAEYNEYLKKINYLDFDDLLNKTVEILKNNPKVREKWSNRYDVILIDEFQDTNDTQYELLKLLCNENTNVFVVGDPDQTIYTWRGADINIIMDFSKDFKGSVDYVLTKNYRSTRTILNCANKLINNNKSRLKKDLEATKDSSAQIICYEAQSNEKEAEWICNRIKELRKKNPTVNYQDFAILYRSNYYSRAIENALINAKMPYKIYGGVKFFMRKEIKDAICYLRILLNDKDYIALERIINVPRRGIGSKTLEDINAKAHERNVDTLTYLVSEYQEKSDNRPLTYFINTLLKYRSKLIQNDLNYGMLINDFLNDLKYVEMLKELEDGEDRVDNINEFVNYLFAMQRDNPLIGLEEILETLSLYSSQDEMVNSDSVTLMTVHTAKGLEYPFVFVCGLAENTFPNGRSILNVESDYEDNSYQVREDKEKVEEERRLAYVAFTRAMKQLFLSYATNFNYGSNSYGVASRFIKEINGTYIPYIKPKKDNYNHDIYYDRKKQEIQQATVNTNSIDYRPGMMVNHKVFGEGIILKIDGDILNIAFRDPKCGVKNISRKFAGLERKG